MDFELLTIKKKPEGKETIKTPLTSIPIDLKVLTENNNDNIEGFINEINTHLFSLRSDYFVKREINFTIGKAIKLSKKIILVELSNEEKDKIKQKIKQTNHTFMSMGIQQENIDDNEEKKDQPMIMKRKLKKMMKVIYQLKNK